MTHRAHHVVLLLASQDERLIDIEGVGEAGEVLGRGGVAVGDEDEAAAEVVVVGEVAAGDGAGHGGAHGAAVG